MYKYYINDEFYPLYYIGYGLETRYAGPFHNYIEAKRGADILTNKAG